MHYEKANIEDLYEILDLVKEVFDEFEAPYYSEIGVKNFYKYANYDNLKDLLEKNLKMIVCKENNKIIGIISYRDLSHISMLFVCKKYHRQGIATNLFEQMKDDCRKNNKDLKRITVNSSPYAIEFYHKIGFIDVSDEKEIDGIKFTPMEINLIDNE